MPCGTAYVVFDEMKVRSKLRYISFRSGGTKRHTVDMNCCTFDVSLRIIFISYRYVEILCDDVML